MTGTRPVIPSSQSSFAEFKKQALEKEERVCVVSSLFHTSNLSFGIGESSEGARATKVAAEEANGIGTTTITGREKEVRWHCIK